MLFVCMHAPWVPLTFPHPWRNHCTRTPVCLLRASAQEPMSPKEKNCVRDEAQILCETLYNKTCQVFILFYS